MMKILFAFFLLVVAHAKVISKGKSKVVRVCEGKQLKIDCNADEKIEVVNANYGRALADICPGSNALNTKCNNQKHSFKVVQSICSTKSSCTIKATNGVFGDPCVGTFKYLEVQYNCLLLVNGGWSDWSNYSACSASCDKGTKTRTRTCSNPVPRGAGKNCVGDSSETIKCNLVECKVNGGFGNWTDFSFCSKSCGEGIQTRLRECNQPAPANGGEDCKGVTVETKMCKIVNCPINGNYSEWNSWGSCSRDCGTGIQTRQRECNNPKPQYGGNCCESIGPNQDSSECKIKECPINGGFGNWNSFSLCSKSCGDGIQFRFRKCNQPAPSYGGHDCDGDLVETNSCKIVDCPINGNYGEWNSWGNCSKDCGTGVQTRQRECNNPKPQYGGNSCESIGPNQNSRDCKIKECPSAPQIARACEGYDLKIDCKGDGTIEIVDANYGRTLSGICPGANDLNTKCDNQKKSLEVLSNSCSSKSSCTIKAANAVFGDPCVGTYKYLEVKYNCKPRALRVCEGSDLKIDCNGEGTIEIVSANYGRTLTGVCPGAQDSNTKCDNQFESFDIVHKSCSSKSSCTVKASNSVFGDPCVGTYKYLEVQYTCKPQSNIARACEGNNLNMDCKGKGIIEVVNANYGRTMSGVCPGANDINTKCDNKQKSLDVVQSSCSGKSSCIVKAANAIFGDPCYGTYKYLEVEYSCKSQVARACEGNDLIIDCNGEGTVEVVYANYGRTHAGICPGSNDVNTKCKNPEKSLEVVQKTCSAKSSCIVKASNTVFGDPCVGTYKYLEVQYNCKPQTVQACEGNSLKIDCQGRGVIDVVNANYGRTISGICPGANDMNTKCENQKKSLEVVYNSCSSKSSCVVKAENAVFGDPCYGTYKYLDVQYTCKPRVARACEGKEIKINCNADETIEVVNANYGRNLAGICPGANDLNTKCDHQKASLDIIQKSCSTKSSCAVKAENAVFGDPCVGTYKYLEVQFNCISKPLVARACEGNDLKIDCNGKGTVNVVSANYGRTLAGVCPGANDSNTKCDNQEKSIEIVQLNCSNKASCIIKAANSLFGDPCYGTYKYLEVQYTCK